MRFARQALSVFGLKGIAVQVEPVDVGGVGRIARTAQSPSTEHLDHHAIPLDRNGLVTLSPIGQPEQWNRNSHPIAVPRNENHGGQMFRTESAGGRHRVLHRLRDHHGSDSPVLHFVGHVVPNDDRLKQSTRVESVVETVRDDQVARR